MKYLKWFLLAALAIFGFLYWELYTVASDSSVPVFFEIAQREAFADVIGDLKEKGLVRNEIFTRLYGRFSGLDKKVRAGRYRIDPALSPVRVLSFLANPEHGEISVTIPEGFSVFDIDEKLAGLGLIREGDFIAWARAADFSKYAFIKDGFVEGYLFPDTYFVFADNFHPRDLGEKMLGNFEKQVVKGLESDLRKSKRSLAEIINMASILEREARMPEDYAVIAGILWKRLDHNWPLQADATVLYGKKERGVSQEILREDSSHNTYTRSGLPKTPIGNPGLKAIRASLNPTETQYWFYLTDKNGKAVYAKTNAEHEKNKRDFL